MDTVRRRRIGRGEGHQEVQELLTRAQRLTSLAALAIFDDPERGGDVMRWINGELGRAGGDAFKAANEGAHGEFSGVHVDLIRDAEKLARRIEAIR